MAAGVTDRVWEIADIVRLLEERENAKKEGRSERYEWMYSSKGPALGFQL